MNKITLISLKLLLILSYQQLHGEYWKESSWYTTCYETLFGQSIENSIPELIMQYDENILATPTNLRKQALKPTHILYCNKEFCIQATTKKISFGITYQVFQQILESIPAAKDLYIELLHNTSEEITFPMAVGSSIILHNQYQNCPDATKLFILYHELQHHIYNDVADNHLLKMIQQAKTSQTKEQLAIHQLSLKNHIRRYIEYRADSQAMLMTQCPYCLEEIAQNLQASSQKYNPQGYLHPWQYQPRIDKLMSEKKCCQHHNDTGNIIDLSIIDESSLLNRLTILQS